MTFRRHRASVALSLFLVSGVVLSVFGGGDGARFILVGKGRTSSPTLAAREIGDFAEVVSSGASALCVGAVVVFAFQVPSVSFSSPVDGFLYLDTASKSAPFALLVSASPTSGKSFSKVRVGKRVFPAKAVDGAMLVSDSEALLGGLSAPPPSLESDSALSAEFFPAAFLDRYPGGMAAFADYAASLASKGKREFKNNRFASLEALLKQTASVRVAADADKSSLRVSIVAVPRAGSPFATALAAKKGEISESDLLALGRELSKDGTLDIHKEITDVAAFLLKSSTSPKDGEFSYFSKLVRGICVLKASSDGKNLHLELSATPEAFKGALDDIKAMKKGVGDD